MTYEAVNLLSSMHNRSKLVQTAEFRGLFLHKVSFTPVVVKPGQV